MVSGLGYGAHNLTFEGTARPQASLNHKTTLNRKSSKITHTQTHTHTNHNRKRSDTKKITKHYEPYPKPDEHVLKREANPVPTRAKLQSCLVLRENGVPHRPGSGFRV